VKNMVTTIIILLAAASLILLAIQLSCLHAYEGWTQEAAETSLPDTP
jgi:hypothetical protein